MCLERTYQSRPTPAQMYVVALPFDILNVNRLVVVLTPTKTD